MIGAARNHPVELARVLGLPELVYVVFGMTLGFPADDPVPRGRLPLGAILHRETYDDEGIAAHLAAADDDMRAWARRANREQGGYGGRPVDERKGWTDRMARLWGDAMPHESRALLGAELRRLGFALDVGPAEDRGDGAG
jgi:hypothetical protein